MIAELGGPSDYCRMAGRDSERVIVDDGIGRVGRLKRLDLRFGHPRNFDAAFFPIAW